MGLCSSPNPAAGALSPALWSSALIYIVRPVQIPLSFPSIFSGFIDHEFNGYGISGFPRVVSTSGSWSLGSDWVAENHVNGGAGKEKEVGSVCGGMRQMGAMS